MSLERQRRDLVDGPGRGLVWRPDMGERVVQFVERYCRHHKGEWAGKPLILEEWQRWLLRTIFGWYRADGTRRYRTAYVELARKNGKSELASAVALYLLLADGEPGAEVFSSATKLDQAKIVWATAKEMVARSPALKRHIKTFTAPSRLLVERTASEFKPLGSDSSTLDGLNPHGSVVDELHAHANRGVWDVLASAMGARRQPLTFAITTAGQLDETTVGWEQHEYATKVLSGVFVDDSFFAFIAAADEGCDYFSDAAWEMASPNIDVSVKRDYLRERAAAARAKPGELGEYLTKHLNVWASARNAWLNMESWTACEPEPVTREEHESRLAGLECVAGLDLSSKLDLTALVAEFRTPRGHELVCRFWLPEARVEELERRGQKHYRTWVDAGWLTTTPGNVVDYEFIRAEIGRFASSFLLREVAFDPWNSTDLVNRLQSDGILCVECRQGHRTLSEPSKSFEASVVERRLRHGNNPVLRWCASNVSVETDANGNIRPVKPAMATGRRIDGVVAAIMARARSFALADVDPYDSGTGFAQL